MTGSTPHDPARAAFERQLRQFSGGCDGCAEDLSQIVGSSFPVGTNTGSDRALHRARQFIAGLETSDRACLERMLAHLIFCSQFGYVLFGSRPLSLSTAYPAGSPQLHLKYGPQIELSLAEKGLAILQNLSSNGIRFKLFDPLNRNNPRHLIIFDQGRVLKTMQLNMDLLAEGDSASNVVERLCTASDFYQAFAEPGTGQIRHDLIGLALGFDRNDALFFHRAEALKRGETAAISEFESVDAELTYYSERRSFFGGNFVQSNNEVQPVEFVGDRDSVTAPKVVEGFESERRRISTVMAASNWLEQACAALISD